MSISSSAPRGHNPLREALPAARASRALQGAAPAAQAFASFLLGEGGQTVLRAYGFGSP